MIVLDLLGKNSRFCYWKCYLISNVVNCHNEYKEPSEKYLLAPGMSDKMYINLRLC